MKKYTKIGTDVANNFYETEENEVENCSEGTMEEDFVDDTKPNNSSNSDEYSCNSDESDEMSDGDNMDEEDPAKSSNSSNSDQSSDDSSSDSMPLPLFLLNKNSMDYAPMEVTPLPVKTEHQTRKSNYYYMTVKK